jgi:Myb-like DNA-binding domain
VRNISATLLQNVGAYCLALYHGVVGCSRATSIHFTIQAHAERLHIAPCMPGRAVNMCVKLRAGIARFTPTDFPAPLVRPAPLIRPAMRFSPDVRHGEWSVGEEEQLAALHCELGSAWTRISQALPGRPANACKNKFNGTARVHATDCSQHANQLQQLRQSTPTTRLCSKQFVPM